VKPERDGARPGLENFQQKIIVAHIDLGAKHSLKNCGFPRSETTR